MLSPFARLVGDGTKVAPVVARYLPPDRPELKWLNT